MENTKTYVINEKLLNEILTVLGQLPYIQSAGLIKAIHEGVKASDDE